MRILALDLATCTGFAFGEAGAVPDSGSVRLARPGVDHHQASRALGTWVRKRFFTFKPSFPDLIIAEQFLDPSAQLHGAVVVTQLLLHGALDAVAACYGVEVRRHAASSIRKHFCGQAFALPRSKQQRTPKEKAEARKATKAMVLSRCHMLGYFPRSVTDDNRADACATFDFAAATIARTPVSFVLTPERSAV